MGYCLELALPLLFRADSGLCRIKIMQEISTRDPRSAPVQATAAQRVLGTNFLICVFIGKDAPLRHAARRMTQHAGRRVLGLGANGSAHRESAHGFRFFTRALDVGAVPSCLTLRQRMDTHVASWFELAGEFNQALLPVNKYLRSLGYCLEMALPLLFRADSGLCTLKITQEISTRNPRSTAWRRAWRLGGAHVQARGGRPRS